MSLWSNDLTTASVRRAWTIGATVLAAIVLIGGAVTAMFAMSKLINASATDSEVLIAFNSVNSRVASHERHVDPKLIQLAGGLTAIEKATAYNAWQTSRDALARDRAFLYDVQKELKAAPSDAAAARENNLLRDIGEGERENQRNHCAYLKLAGNSCF